MIVLKSKGKLVPLKPFDPSLKKGMDTYIVNRKTGRRFKVKKYYPLTGELHLIDLSGGRIKSMLRPHLGLNYDVVREKKS